MTDKVEAKPSAPWPPVGRGWVLVLLLAFASVLSVLDRVLLALMVDPIRRDLGLSDTQIGLLIGLAFALFYAAMGIPLGRLADRGNRRLIVAAGIFVWSLATMASGLAMGFAGLFLARMVVGAGEASLNPNGLSLISDHFPPEKRSRPASLFLASNSMGGALAYIIGGALIGAMQAYGGQVLPLMGPAEPWQLVFLLAGLPGILLAVVIVCAVREPVRQEGSAQPTASLAETFAYVRQRGRLFGPLLVAPAIGLMVVIGIQSWSPALFTRVYGWSPADTGLAIGLIVLICAPTGTMIGAWLAERSRARKSVSGDFNILLACSAGGGTLLIAAALQPTAWGFLLLFAPGVMMINSLSTLPPVIFQFIVPNQLRGQLVSFFFLMTALVGNAGGALSVALFTDHVFESSLAVGKSIALLGAIAIPISCLLLLWGRRLVNGHRP